MTTATLQSPLPRLIDRRTGEVWQILSISTTSDGFRLASAVLVDGDHDGAEPVLDEGGFEVIRSLFLGRA